MSIDISVKQAKEGKTITVFERPETRTTTLEITVQNLGGDHNLEASGTINSRIHIKLTDNIQANITDLTTTFTKATTEEKNETQAGAKSNIGKGIMFGTKIGSTTLIQEGVKEFLKAIKLITP